MYVIIRSWPENNEEQILVDEKGEPLIYSTHEDAEKAIDAELDKFVEELIISMEKITQKKDNLK